MLPWWWILISLIAGMLAGALITVVFALDKSQERWWDDDQ